MSGKTLIFLGVVVACGYALTRNPPPIPPGSTAADTVAISQAGYGARLKYGIGSFGSALMGRSVRNTIAETEQSLKDLKPAIKATRGPDGVRAIEFAAKVTRIDSVALIDLQYGHPIKAAKAAMEAKSILGAVRSQVTRQQ